VRIALFSGGRGCATITAALAQIRSVHLTVIVNAYDDGLSTGRIRSLVPGMLGPSDVRKNFSNLLPVLGNRGSAIARLLECRIDPSDLDPEDEREQACWPIAGLLGSSEDDLTVAEARQVRRWAVRTTDLLKERLGDSASIRAELQGMSMGNLLFCGAFLEQAGSFNEAIRAWNQTFCLPASIVNITDGSNRVLVGLKEDGTILESEARIVEQQSKDRLRRAFLLPQYLSDADLAALDAMTVDERYETLLRRESIPSLSAEATEAISTADVIVYGPGTQHSSLLPSYLTSGVADLIASRSDVEKVFISNLDADHDIQSESFKTLLAKVVEYLNAGSQAQHQTSALITRCLVSTDESTTTPWGFESMDDGDSVIGVMVGHWSATSRTHDGPRVARAILSLGSGRKGLKSASGLRAVSIVIPVLDEIRTLPTVLSDLLLYDWVDAGILPEFIVVDGGSIDGSWEAAEAYPTVTRIRLPRGSGRGEALRAGIRAGRADYLVCFPSDGEYAVDAVVRVCKALDSGESPIVFGSRVGMCADTDARLRSIYGGRTRAYYLSKWGGTVLILAAGLMHKRWISDPLTGIKGFTRNAIERLSLAGDGVDWDMQVIAEAARLEVPLAEVPVHFVPRGVKEGKKMRPRDGLQALWRLLKPKAGGISP